LGWVERSAGQIQGISPDVLPHVGETLVDGGYRSDLIVEGKVLVELKAIEKLLPIHEAQVLTYLKLTGLRVGLLMNFNVTSLRLGLRRFVR
jgi:GxxExxY protein